MNKNILPHLYLGLAAGFLIWGIQEVYLLALVHNLAGRTWTIILGGTLLGASYGGLLLAKEGLLQNNRNLLHQGLKWGLGFGAVGGAMGFYLSSMLQLFGLELGVLEPYLIWMERMLFITLAVGMAQGTKDQSSLQSSRGLILGTIVGLVSGLAIAMIEQMALIGFYQRGLAYLFLGVLMSLVALFLSSYKRNYWLLSLNGTLAGREFELSKETHYLGTQAEDQINLASYEEVNSTHAKLIRYETGYSLVDNDPFCATFVNFRNITEQPLKNGDIIKVGSAIFQYCTLD